MSKPTHTIIIEGDPPFALPLGGRRTMLVIASRTEAMEDAQNRFGSMFRNSPPVITTVGSNPLRAKD